MRREITSYKITYRNGNIKKQLKSGVRTVLETSTQLNDVNISYQKQFYYSLEFCKVYFYFYRFSSN